MSQLVSVAELSDLLNRGADVRVLDVRWRLDQPDGREAYAAGHIPGAVYVDLDHELADVDDPAPGRHPLPTTAALQDAARRWGVNAGDLVVAYDDTRGVAAARAWWLLRQAGVDVVVLDGGLRAWTGAGGQLEEGVVTAVAGDVELTAIGAGVLTIDEAAAFPDTGVLLDVRAAERYRGDSEPIDPIGGHIPGAVNLPTAAHFGPDGLLLDVDGLRENFAAVGITPGTAVAAYCGSGIAATHTALALTEAGIDVAVFPGSWSHWSTSGRPIATGQEPSAAITSPTANPAENPTALNPEEANA